MERNWKVSLVCFSLQMTADLKLLGSVQVEYETLPGWNQDISKCRSFQELPLNAQNYIKRIEALIGVPGMIVNSNDSALDWCWCRKR